MQALIAVGSNIDPAANVRRALALLDQLDDVSLRAVSHIYRTPALDPAGLPIPDAVYLNAAVLVETSLTPEALKHVLRTLEARLGRRRDRTAGALPQVTIDLDLVMAAAEDGSPLTCHTAHGRLPHPDVLRRAHVALPLADIAPDWLHPDTNQCLRAIALGLSHTEMERTDL